MCLAPLVSGVKGGQMKAEDDRAARCAAWVRLCVSDRNKKTNIRRIGYSSGAAVWNKKNPRCAC
eukprot:6187720-Pleurochrysis_carterae.AAC.1